MKTPSERVTGFVTLLHLGFSNTEPNPEEAPRALITLLYTSQLSFGSLLKVTVKNTELTRICVKKKDSIERKRLGTMSCVMAVLTEVLVR